MVMAIINLILSVFLCQKHGAIGAAAGTAISLVLANGLAINIYYHKKCDLDVIVFWKNILRQAIGLIPPIVLGFFLDYYMEYHTIGSLIGSIAGYTLVYCVAVWFISTNKYEKTLVTNFLNKLLRRRRAFVSCEESEEAEQHD